MPRLMSGDAIAATRQFLHDPLEAGVGELLLELHGRGASAALVGGHLEVDDGFLEESVGFAFGAELDEEIRVRGSRCRHFGSSQGLVEYDLLSRSRGGQMASLSGAVADVAGSVRAVVGLSRPGRLRDQIEHTLDLHAKTVSERDLSEARAHLARTAELQAEALLNAVDPNNKRKLNWGPFVVALTFFDLPLAGLTYWGWQYTAHWWGWAWFAVSGFLLLVLLAASVYALVSSGDD